MAMVSLLAFQRWIYQWLWVLVEDQTLLRHTVLLEEKTSNQVVPQFWTEVERLRVA
jgi:hypothetical protein